MDKILMKLEKQVIISVQAAKNEPLYQEDCLNAMIKSVVNGGAKALRLAGERDIKNAKKMFPDIPVIGITKPDVIPENFQELVYITPSVEDVEKVVAAGAEIIAFDATLRKREKNSLSEIFKRVKDFGCLAMADIATLEEGLAAGAMGVDLISTTLSGYTQNSLTQDSEPDYNLLIQLVKKVKTPIILEGRIWSVEQIKKAFGLGAFAVVVGSAVTRPQLITKRFLDWRNIYE